MLRLRPLRQHPLKRWSSGYRNPLQTGARLQWLSSTSNRTCSCSNPQPNPPSESSQQPASPGYRALGNLQDLYTTSPYSPGSPLFLPNGTHLVNKLIAFLRTQYLQYGFREVLSPTIYRRSLWEVSGHWQNYKDDMYEVAGRGETGRESTDSDSDLHQDELYALKPMNCPGHCLMFKSQNRSYRDLPIRYADFSPLHRNEASGALTGLTRVRRFHQDDGHIFCRPQQIKGEIASALGFVDMVMATFGLGPYRLALSTRPESDYIGSLQMWDSAETQLREALDNTGKEWALNEGDGAFYGPKIDIQLQDETGKYHQLSTIQLDMNLPQRFELEYISAEGEDDYNPASPTSSTPVLIHRAIFGSLERFLALLIERFNGRWPFWISPLQGIILTINQDESLIQGAHDAAAKISGFSTLVNDGTHPPKPLSSLDPTFLIDVDTSAQSLSKKIQRAKQMKYNLIFVLGAKDLADSSVTADFTGQMQVLTDQNGERMKDVVVRRFGEDVLKKPRAVKLRIEDVHGLLVDFERNFL